ncbi:hypothetical protein HK104_011119 [Borealophlyctis nickersoniae]|nr:hypothetical protein HK104_011119 [Borealophlyctis nickersoniae]
MSGAFGQVDAASSGDRRPMSSRMRNDLGEEYPLLSLDEVAERWKAWAETYRARLMGEMPPVGGGSGGRPSVTSPATPAPPTGPQIDLEDIHRMGRMKKCNPRYTLRGWICEELVNSVETESGCVGHGKRGPKVAGLKKEARVSGGEVHAPPTPAGGGGSNALGPGGCKSLERAMRVLIQDVWGEQAESTAGWKDEEDRKAAERWAGEAPEWAQNLLQTSSS